MLANHCRVGLIPFGNTYRVKLIVINFIPRVGSANPGLEIANACGVKMFSEKQGPANLLRNLPCLVLGDMRTH